MPAQTETLNLAFTLNYIQADATGTNVTDNGIELIEFSLENIKYQAVQGMTWKDWLESSYSPENYHPCSGITSASFYKKR